MSQSSNDVIPTCIHLSAALLLNNSLLPALDHLAQVLRKRAEDLVGMVKTGRTHLMDAMPVTFTQELGGGRPKYNRLRRGCVMFSPGFTGWPSVAPLWAQGLMPRRGLPTRFVLS